MRGGARRAQFTVVAAYERQVARGHLRAQRGSGFYVCEPHVMPLQTRVAPRTQQIDTAWLVRNMQSGIAPKNSPGYGYLCEELYGTDLLRQGLRSVAQSVSKQLMHVGLS